MFNKKIIILILLIIVIVPIGIASSYVLSGSINNSLNYAHFNDVNTEVKFYFPATWKLTHYQDKLAFSTIEEFTITDSKTSSNIRINYIIDDATNLQGGIEEDKTCSNNFIKFDQNKYQQLSIGNNNYLQFSTEVPSNLNKEIQGNVYVKDVDQIADNLFALNPDSQNYPICKELKIEYTFNVGNDNQIINQYFDILSRIVGSLQHPYLLTRTIIVGNLVSEIHNIYKQTNKFPVKIEIQKDKITMLNDQNKVLGDYNVENYKKNFEIITDNSADCISSYMSKQLGDNDIIICYDYNDKKLVNVYWDSDANKPSMWSNDL